MSYSAQVDVDKATINADLDHALAGIPGNDVDHVKDHVAAIHTAVEHLAGVVGRPEDPLYVSISGHANPDHAPADGWADETITVSISARPAKEEPAA